MADIAVGVTELQWTAAFFMFLIEAQVKAEQDNPVNLQGTCDLWIYYNS